MKASEIALLNFLKGPKQFVIPIYQRKYSWSLKQCEVLWRDILSAATSASRGHFIGSIVYVERGLFQVASLPQLLVIDGQQRLTTLTLLLAAFAKAMEGKELVGDMTSRKVTNYFLFNSEEEGDLELKLRLTDADHATLKAILKGVPVKGLVALKIKTNFEFFASKLAELEDIAVVYQGLLKLIVVDISLDREHDNPQLIFESLNSTGLKLTQADLIRNFILMGLDPKDQDHLYQNFWSHIELIFGTPERGPLFDRFMRDYLTIKNRRIPNLDEVYEEFKAYSFKGGQNSEEVVSDIYRYALRYEAITFATEQNAALKLAFESLSQLKIDVINPFLLEVYDDMEQGILTAAEFQEVLSYLESYILRRLICGIPTNSLSKTFATIYRDIDKSNYVDSFLIALCLKESYQRFPSDEEFSRELAVKDIYNLRNKGYFLLSLENFDRKEKIHLSGFSVEHILPQNSNLNYDWRTDLGPEWKVIQERYLHTIGNLTLSAYNSEFSDSSFLVKRDLVNGKGEQIGLGASPLHLNAGLGELDVWNEVAINNRAQSLIRRSLLCWPYPHRVASKLIESGRSSAKNSNEERSATVPSPYGFYQVYWSGLKDYLIAENSMLKVQTPREQHWVTFAIGKTNVSLNAYANNRDNRLTVAISMWGPSAPSYFEQLAEHRDEIELAFGGELEWRNTPGNKVRHVAVKVSDEDPADEESRVNQFDWFKKTLERFREVFTPYVQELKS